jgi:tetratricopeptide (TPR) repeat protein
MAGAIADYTEAIRLQPGFFEAYGNRGMAKQRLGLHEEARQDYETAVSMSPGYSDARKCLQGLDEIGPVIERTFPRPTEPPAEPTWEKGHNMRFLLT